jgi:CheY-like chemotaxis protein
LNRIGPKKLAQCLLSIFDGLQDIDPADARSGLPTSEFHSTESSELSIRSVPTAQNLDDSQQSGKMDQNIASSTSNDRPLILLVEDNIINMRILVTCVTRLRAEYSTAENGAEAVEAYQTAIKKPDIIFLDISMPVMNGFDAAKHIRSYELENNLPAAIIVAVTGLASEESQREAYNIGINLFLSKPVSLDKLRKIVQNWKARNASDLTEENKI